MVNSNSVVIKNLWWVSLFSGILAILGNLTIYFIALNLTGRPLVINTLVRTGQTTLSMSHLILAGFLPAIAGSLLIAILARTTHQPIPVFQISVFVILLLSLALPIIQPIDSSTKIIIILMHILTAIIIVGVISTLGYSSDADFGN